MATPTKKDEGLERFIDSITPNPLGRRGSILANVCALCGDPATTFTDALSEKEYRISGICQGCQDLTFNPEEETDGDNDLWEKV